jgi:hypothetical protein
VVEPGVADDGEKLFEKFGLPVKNFAIVDADAVFEIPWSLVIASAATLKVTFVFGEPGGTLVTKVTVHVPFGGIVNPDSVAEPLVAGNAESTEVPPQFVVADTIENLEPALAVIGNLTPVSASPVGLVSVNVWVIVLVVSAEAVGDAAMPMEVGTTCSVCDAELAFDPWSVCSAPAGIVLMPLPTTAPTTLKVIVQVPGDVELSATGIWPLFIETTVPEIDGVPPGHVVAKLLGLAIVAFPAIVAMSSENAVMVAALTVDVFCSVTVTVDTCPNETLLGENALFTRTAASETAAHSASEVTNAPIARATSAPPTLLTECAVPYPSRRFDRYNCSE